MKKFLKWTGIVLILITIMMVFAVLGKSDVLELSFERIDLLQISDGTYTGKYDNFRWSTQVDVEILDHKIVEIKPTKIQSGRDSLVKDLTNQIVMQQRSDVDAISGATASSNAFLKAVEIALKSAKVK